TSRRAAAPTIPHMSLTLGYELAILPPIGRVSDFALPTCGSIHRGPTKPERRAEERLSAFLRPLPAPDRRLTGARDRELARRRIRADRGTGADRGVLADRDGGHERGIGADERAVFDGRAMFVDAVVVAGDRPGADVHAGTDAGVAEIGQMVRLGAFADRAVLHFDEVADMRATRDFGAGAQSRERADRAVAVRRHAVEIAMRQNDRACGEPRMPDPAERGD